MDQEWLKNLATAEFDGRRWRPKNHTLVENTEKRRRLTSIDDLLGEVRDAVGVFNHYSKDEIQIVSRRAETSPRVESFSILYKGVQCFVKWSKDFIEAKISKKYQYERRDEKKIYFMMVSDNLGWVMWKNRHGMLLSLDLVGKSLLEELVRHAFEK